MTPEDEPYDQSFFAGQSARSLQSARVVLGRVFPWLLPRRVLDVGCGVGTWLRAALDLGAGEVAGTDGSYVDRAQLLIDPASFVPADLAAQSVRDALGERAATPFDLVICMEVAEHLPYGRAPALVAELASLGDAVLFSAAVPFQYGTQHVNEQWPEFWAILFRAQGFSCYDCLRAGLWADTKVDWWYAQNALLFARDGSAAAGRLPPESRVDGRGLSVVHPENLLANLLGLARRHRQDAYQEEVQDLRSLIAANLRLQPELPALAAPARAERSAPNARNVFPWTRIEIHQPEQEIADLARELAEARALLTAAEGAHSAVRAALALEREARSRAETFADSAQKRTQAQAGARLFAETRLSEMQAAEAARQDELAGARRDLADARARWQDATETALQEKAAALAAASRAEAVVAALSEALADRSAALEDRNQEVEAMRSSPFWRAERRIRAIDQQLPKPMRHVVRRLARRPLPGQWPSPVPPPAPEPLPMALSSPANLPAEPLDEQAVPVEGAPAKPQIKCYDTVLGEVNWWTLAAAVTRLRRFELFDPEDYLRRNPEVAIADIDPHEHFLQSGALEGRGRFDPEELARLMSGLMLFDHAVRALPPELEDDADLPGLVADVGHVGIYVSSHGNMFMEEIAADLAADLRSAGVRVDLLDENAPIDDRPPVCLFIAPHEFFILGRGPQWVRDDVFSDGFMFGTEQVQTTWFQLALPFILMSRGTLDLCSQTADLFTRTNMASLHVLPGARLRPHRLTGTDRQHPLFGVLPAAARSDPDPRRRFAERPIDVSFFGTSSPRRDAFFARNAGFLADYETFNYCRRPGRGPLQGGSEDGALTRLAGHVCGHSKITLNIHREEFGYFEWHRMVRLGMCSGSVVVSDPCLPDPSFIANEHYFQEQARHIPDLLEWLLTTEDGVREAERVRANADMLITNVFNTTHTVARTLRFLSQHRSRAGQA